MYPVKLDNLYFEVIDYTTFGKADAEGLVEEIIKMYGHEVSHFSEVGHPDFKVTKKDGTVYYVEVKTNGDGLRREQFEWILKHKHEQVIIFFVNQIDQNKEVEKEKKKKLKKEEERKEVEKLSKHATQVL